SPIRTIQQIQVTAPGGMYRSRERGSIPFYVNEHRCRYFIPVPGVVRLILEMGNKFAGLDIDNNGRGCVQVISWASSRPKPGTTVTGTPVAQSGITVIRTCDPNGCAASLPRVPGPCIVAFFSRARYRVGFPDTVAA